MSTHADPAREFLRHTLATLAYRGGKVLRDAPEGFGSFRLAAGDPLTPIAVGNSLLFIALAVPLRLSCSP